MAMVNLEETQRMAKILSDPENIQRILSDPENSEYPKKILNEEPVEEKNIVSDNSKKRQGTSDPGKELVPAASEGPLQDPNQPLDSDSDLDEEYVKERELKRTPFKNPCVLCRTPDNECSHYVYDVLRGTYFWKYCFVCRDRGHWGTECSGLAEYKKKYNLPCGSEDLDFSKQEVKPDEAVKGKVDLDYVGGDKDLMRQYASSDPGKKLVPAASKGPLRFFYRDPNRPWDSNNEYGYEDNEDEDEDEEDVKEGCEKGWIRTWRYIY